MNKYTELPNGNVIVRVDVQFRYVKQHRVLVIPENEEQVISQTPLLLNIARGFVWQRMLDARQYSSIDELAKALGKERALVSHALQLTILSPEIIHLAIKGKLPSSINLKSLRVTIPADWQKQKELFGI